MEFAGLKEQSIIFSTDQQKFIFTLKKKKKKSSLEWPFKDKWTLIKIESVQLYKTFGMIPEC